MNRSASIASSITLCATYPPTRDVERGIAPPTFIPAPAPRRTNPPAAQSKKEPQPHRGRLFLETVFSGYVLLLILASSSVQAFSFLSIILGRKALSADAAVGIAVDHAGYKATAAGCITVGVAYALFIALLFATIFAAVGERRVSRSGRPLSAWSWQGVLIASAFSLLALFAVQGAGALVLNWGRVAGEDAHPRMIYLSPPAPGDPRRFTADEVRLLFKAGAVGMPIFWLVSAATVGCVVLFFSAPVGECYC